MKRHRRQLTLIIMWGNFLAIASAILSVTLVVSMGQWVHADTASKMYASTILAHSNGEKFGDLSTIDITTDANAVKASEILTSLGREGAKWARNTRFETMVWAVVLFVVMVVILGYYYWMSR